MSNLRRNSCIHFINGSIHRTILEINSINNISMKLLLSHTLSSISHVLHNANQRVFVQLRSGQNGSKMDSRYNVKVKSLSHFRLFATPWTVAHRAPLSMGFSRQEYWSGLPLPSPKLLQLYPTLCNPMDCSPPCSSVHGISQARTLELGCHFLLQGIFPT